MMPQSGVPEIDGFTFIKELGRGAVATVWEARQHDPDRVVAIKLLRDDITGSPEEVEAFYAEARRAAELDHENIVTVFEVGCQRGYYYYVMELASGYDTAKWLRRKGHLKQGDVLTIAESVAVALEYAERTIGLIHCDIKPGNIMVDGDGSVRITDLGIARLSRGWNADDGYVCGTPQFMSPEQAKGDKLDARADIYSLGATMYALLTGHRLFDGRADVEIMDAQCAEYVSDVREFNPDVSYPLAFLITQMLAKDREDRVQNWPTVIDSIRRVINGEMPIGALPGNSTMKLEECAKTPNEAQSATGAGQIPVQNVETQSKHVNESAVAESQPSGPGGKPDSDEKPVTRKASPKHVHIHREPRKPVTDTTSVVAEKEKTSSPAIHNPISLSPSATTAAVKRELDSMRGFAVRTAIASVAVFALAYFVTRYFVTR